MSRYIALAHRGDSGSWGISFPDFPGCISAADSFEDVVERGAEALQFHVEGLLEDGAAIAEPRALEALRADPEFADDFEGAIVTLVPLLPPRDRPMRVNVVLDATLLASIDRSAEQLGLNRSEFLAEGARRMIVSPQVILRADPARGTPPDVAPELMRSAAAGTELSDFTSPKAKEYVVRSTHLIEGSPIRPAGRDAATGRLAAKKGRHLKGVTKHTKER